MMWMGIWNQLQEDKMKPPSQREIKYAILSGFESAELFLPSYLIVTVYLKIGSSVLVRINLSHTKGMKFINFYI